MITQTSLEAYLSMESKIERRQRLVYNYIAMNPDLNAEQIYIGMGFRSPNSTSPRITELLQDGRIEVSGYSETSSGRRARTYRVVVEE